MISEEDRRIVQQSSEDRLKLFIEILFRKIQKCEKQTKRVPNGADCSQLVHSIFHN